MGQKLNECPRLNEITVWFDVFLFAPKPKWKQAMGTAMDCNPEIQ